MQTPVKSKTMNDRRALHSRPQTRLSLLAGAAFAQVALKTHDFIGQILTKEIKSSQSNLPFLTLL